ncbi:tetratricopeptide repeat protein (plasmid) [Paroceanicella profunda]|uniref:Tetratricopeptide repeat protein 38 n=1 Tax=Paroceanicella profunda TaxID=2579971 RepID=A0A5B8G0G3_9RHOB|nr:tetratricopeptide repeat protein [Paroceanicella profunda]QDL94205.1 tetratricopeptide repeat protein [Paroceanicella profunda]
MVTDCLGNPVSCRGAALDAVNDFTDGFLRYHPKATNVLGVIGGLEDCLPHVFAGYLWMFLQRPEAPERARPHALAAAAAAPRAHARERAHLGVLEAWMAGDWPGMIRRAEAITAAWPQDLVALKLVQTQYLNLGDSPGILRSALRLLPANAGNAHVHGMVAFGFEQCHLLDEARAAAEAALARDASEPWAHHALAHVHLTRGEIDAGRRFMAGVSGHWEGLNSFMYTHNWWHTALFDISAGDGAAALAIHDEHCWGIAPDYSQDQVGAVSLLARLDFAGIDTGGRWQALRPWLETRGADVESAFLTLQYLYGLGRAGSPVADDLMEAVRARAASAPPWAAAMWRETALPACEGVLAAARGNHAEAIRRLGPALPTLWKVGGSHAQRDLFEQIFLDSLMQESAWVSAQQLLEARRAFDPSGVPLNRMLAEVYGRLGLPDQQATAAARALRVG